MDDYGYKSWHGSFHAASSIRTACFTSSGALRYSWQVVVYTGGKGGRSNARLTRNVIDYIYIYTIDSFVRYSLILGKFQLGIELYR